MIILLKMFDLILSTSVETLRATSAQRNVCEMCHLHIAVETRLIASVQCGTDLKNENMCCV